MFNHWIKPDEWEYKSFPRLLGPWNVQRICVLIVVNPCCWFGFGRWMPLLWGFFRVIKYQTWSEEIVHVDRNRLFADQFEPSNVFDSCIITDVLDAGVFDNVERGTAIHHHLRVADRCSIFIAVFLKNVFPKWSSHTITQHSHTLDS